jgi:hypothetical protein
MHGPGKHEVCGDNLAQISAPLSHLRRAKKSLVFLLAMAESLS